MADKNVVDDYYSSIKPDANTADDNKKAKPKLKPKRKIVVKKASEKKAEDNLAAKKTPSKVVKKTDKKPNKSDEKPVVKKQFVQKIEVVKKADLPAVRKSESNNNDTKKQDVSKFNDDKIWAPVKTFSKKSKKPVVTKKGDQEVNAKKIFGHKKTRGRFKSTDENEFSFGKGNKLAKRKKEEKKVEDIQQNLTDKTGETVIVPEILSLKEFSEKIGIALPQLMAEFMKNGMMVNINSKLDFDTASIVAEAFDVSLQRDNSQWVKVEDILEWNIADLLVEDDTSKLEDRSPVISIMGHVDHGKTSLLDFIRSSKVTDGEAGGITQSIGAYQVEQHGKKITFLDTPGHEAFTVMRARGAKSTDIAILVVAADEWVKPQTIESINHAKEAGIPVVVAINKMDKEWANPDHVKGQLSEHGLVPEDWGGDTPMIPVSAHTGFGIDDLLEIILLVAEMKELKANPNRTAIATVLESHLDTQLGPVATVLINTGTINKWDNIVCQQSYWKVKILKNHIAKNIKLAGPSQPVLIVGLDRVVQGGDVLQVVSSPDVARQKSIEYKEILLRNKQKSASGLDLLMSKIKAWNLKQLKVIIKADTNGALEAMKGALEKLSTDETTVAVIHSGVWSISEWDILMGQWSGAILIWFSVDVLSAARWTLESSKVEYIQSNIIYHVTERIEKIVTGMLDPKEVEITLGEARVGGIFFNSKEFMIAGLILQPENKIEKSAQIRVIRNKKLVGHGKVESLKSGLIEVNELEGPLECGIKFIWDIELEMKDKLELYKIEIQK